MAKDNDKDWAKFIAAHRLEETPPRYIFDMAWSAGYSDGAGDALEQQIIGGRSFAYTGKPGELAAWEKWMRETGPVEAEPNGG